MENNLTLDIVPKYDRKITEPKIRDFWAEKEIYKFKYDASKPTYSVDTPPPYVSADHLHAGHIMSYAQAEFIVRYKRMVGYNVFYPMGFDDNGLPTERFVEKKYNINKSKISRKEFIDLCLKETQIGSKTYKDLWSNLGISVDWSKTYSTIDPMSTKVSQWSLLDLYKKGALYRKESPILWCTLCQTALSQADVDDAEAETNLVYIDVATTDGDKLTFATTRPELYYSCVGMSVNPNDPKYKNLICKTVIMPLTCAKIELTADDIVNPEFGSGAVYFCSSGDAQFLDWETRHSVKEKIYVVNPNGTLNDLAGKYSGLHLKEARKQIIEDLDALGVVSKIEKITHRLGVHERCETPIDYINSKQWFIKIKDLKETWLELGRQLNWYPKTMLTNYETWVNSLKWDWCISRQRFYGVPFPVWYCVGCEEPVFAEEKDLPVYPTESGPSIDKCPKCGGREFKPEVDVMDTWSTSSCTPFLIAELIDDSEIRGKIFPNTLRPNAHEIIRTWDFYSIVKSYYHFGTLPFRDVMISGHGVDSNGIKFAKRLGNYIPSERLLELYGVDAIRYWATGAKLGTNHRFSEPEIKKGEKLTIKLWNALRFINMNMEGFDPKVDLLSEQVLEEKDTWIIDCYNETVKKVTEAFESYEYARARDEIEKFFWYTFADLYIEAVKPRLRVGDSKKAAQCVLYHLFLGVIKMYAPILPFVTEEIYQSFYKDYVGEESLHLTAWPDKI